MSSEKSFESYFARLCPERPYRMALVNGGGFPDRLLILGEKYFLIELKLLQLGNRGDKTLRGTFQPTQMPWHLDYLINKKGKSLYTLFKVTDTSGNTKYGIVHETVEFCKAVLEGLKYSGLADHDYREYEILKDLIKVEFTVEKATKQDH